VICESRVPSKCDRDPRNPRPVGNGLIGDDSPAAVLLRSVGSDDTMSSLQATRLKRGMLIKMGPDLFRVLDLQHVTPGNLRGFVRAKFRNIRNGSLSDQKLRSEDFLERAVLDEREMQYLYKDGDSFHFMDTSSYEQLHIDAEVLGDSVNYIIADALIKVEFYGTEPVGIELPQTVDLKVEDTAPGIKGATASAQVKPARLETGLVVQVPPFINPGDTIRVSTETGEYLSRA
jgi:elongation factor P